MIARPDLDAWKAIPGWTCRRLREWYDEVAQSIPADGTFVEIGVAYGCSLAYVIARFCERDSHPLYRATAPTLADPAERAAFAKQLADLGVDAIGMPAEKYDVEVIGGLAGIRTVGVDIWQEHQGAGQLDAETWKRVKSHGDAFQACLGELARSASYVFGRTTLVRDTGENAAKLFGPETVDVVFIDEHHTFDSVTAAIRAWLPKVKRGGRLSGHDCNPNYPGVMQAVNELLPGAEVRPPHLEDNGWGGVWIWRKP